MPNSLEYTSTATSFLIRTIAWTSILGERSFVTKVARGVLGDWFTFTGRSWGVVGGLTYNFLPFMILPVYVSLEKIDRRLVEAAQDLYCNARRAPRPGSRRHS